MEFRDDKISVVVVAVCVHVIAVVAAMMLQDARQSFILRAGVSWAVVVAVMSECADSNGSMESIAIKEEPGEGEENDDIIASSQSNQNSTSLPSRYCVSTPSILESSCRGNWDIQQERLKVLPCFRQSLPHSEQQNSLNEWTESTLASRFWRFSRWEKKHDLLFFSNSELNEISTYEC